MSGERIGKYLFPLAWHVRPTRTLLSSYRFARAFMHVAHSTCFITHGNYPQRKWWNSTVTKGQSFFYTIQQRGSLDCQSKGGVIRITDNVSRRLCLSMAHKWQRSCIQTHITELLVYQFTADLDSGGPSATKSYVSAERDKFDEESYPGTKDLRLQEYRKFDWRATNESRCRGNWTGHPRIHS